LEFYKSTVKETLFNLNTSEKGISTQEVNLRQKKYGLNVIVVEKDKTFFDFFWVQFEGFLPWLLIIIAAFAFATGYFMHSQEQLIDGFIVSFIVIINALLGAFQDFKSEKSAKLLKSMLKNNALVLRDGQKKTISADELVPGDIIFLQEGDKIPADCRVIDAKEFQIDESMLTGESVDVFKDTKAIHEEVPLADHKNMVYMNTYVVRGEGICVVVRTGKGTEVGKIAKSLDTNEKSYFLDEVDDASKKITYVALGLIAIALFFFYLKNNDWISVFMLGAALVIGSIPEGLPAIVTFSLAMGSQRLVKEKVLIKRKTLLETLGSVDVLCTDKTGTLTQNKMQVKKIFADMSVISFKSINKKSYEYIRDCALLCNEAKDTDAGLVGDPEDIALINLFSGNGENRNALLKKHPLKKLEPFSSETKYAKSSNYYGKKIITFTKGAPEILLKISTHVLIKGRVRKITKKDKDLILANLEKFSKEALRGIAFSYSPSKKQEVFLGFVGLYDAPKEGIKETIETIYSAGLDVKMITGDNILTARAIAEECGFRNIVAMEWKTLKDLPEKDFIMQVEKCNVFARMSPEFKLRIVNALKENNHRVAITGDGVNDVPALKKADVGIAMGARGSDIAKEASDIILLDDNITSMISSFKEGRTIFSNVRKVINYFLTANLVEVIVVFFFSFLGIVPFLPIQLLWVNFVTDIAPAMALGIDPSHKDIMSKKPTGKKESLINKRITLLTIFIGVKKAIMLVVVYFIAWKVSGSPIVAQTATFSWLVLSHFVRIAAIRFDEKVNLFVNKYLNWSILIPVLLQLLILYTGISGFFHVVPLGWFDWGLLVVTIALAVGLAKIITFYLDKGVPETDKDY